MLSSAADKDQAAVQRLLRIKDNIEIQAKKDVDRLRTMMVKHAKREKLININDVSIKILQSLIKGYPKTTSSFS